jgi:UDP-glucose 4-epimerase
VRLLVTGGAGYIGSISAALLRDAGHDITVLDDFSRGHRAAVPDGAELVEASLLDADAMRRALSGGFDGVLHFAAFALVGESVEHPELYWRNNVVGSLNLLEAMLAADVGRLVFSSTCATYGDPPEVPIRETTPTAPANPYGQSKLAVDRMISDICASHGLGAVSLRYFNVAGASDALGEHHDPETHIIPTVLRVALGQVEHVDVFGTDYPTPDGTAIRDYIHVSDLADAHALALDAAGAGEHRIFNLGNGTGFSVKEVIDTARRVTGHEIAAVEGPRRRGDPPRLVAASELIRSELGWEPRKPGLEEIIGDAWAWHQAHPEGYGS